MDYGVGAVFNVYGNRMTYLENKEAIYDYDTGVHYTYGDLRSRSARIAAYLTKKLGLKKGDRMGICACNREEFFDLFFAAYKTGIILTTYNGRLTPRELTTVITNEAPSILFYDPTYQNTVFNICAGLEVPPKLIALDGDGEDSYAQALKTTDEADPFYPHQEDILMLIHTGGTTGTPKAAMLSYRAVVCNSISMAMTHNLTPKDSSYLMMPLYHTAGWNSVSLGILLAGGRLVVKRNFDVDEAYDIIEKEKPSFILGVPTIYQRMAEHPRFKTADFSSLKALRCGAAPLPAALFHTYDAMGLPLCNAYGLTECGPSNFSFPMKMVTQDVLRNKVGSVGQPMYYNRARIVDENGDPLPANRPGDLQFSGPLVFSGYWNNQEETNKVIRGEWVNTGDIAIYDDDGFYKIIGRKKNMFISGGENIFPIEIEDILMEHPAVQDCCVVGVEDTHWGEVGKALIQLYPDQQGDKEELKAQLKEYLKKHLPSIKVPKYIAFIEKVPRNTTGKLLLREVEALKGVE